MRIFLFTVALFLFPALSHAQGIVTLTAKGLARSNELAVAQGQVAVFKSWMDIGNSSGYTRLRLIKDEITFNYNYSLITSGAVNGASGQPLTIAGPAVIQFYSESESGAGALTLDIQPSPYPPDRAATVGPHSGPVKVTMEESRDLVNWIPANNGATYTNSPDARFFRIVIDKQPGQ